MAASVVTQAVVVNFRTAALTIACAESLLRDDEDTAVLLVDGGSGDGSAERLAAFASLHDRVTTLPLADNLGFGAACNRAFDHALATTPDLAKVLLINPDAVAQPGCVAELLQTARLHPDAGIVGGRVMTADGNEVLFENGAFRPWTLGRSHRGAPPGAAEFETEFVTGALMLLDAELLAAGLRFEEDYFLYVEDLALCRAVRARGRSLWVNTRAVVHHVDGASQGTDEDCGLGMRAGQLYYLTRNKLLFAARHLSLLQRCSVALMTLVLKPLAGIVRARSTAFLAPYLAGVRDGLAGRGGPR